VQRPIRARRAPCRGTAATLPAAGHTVVRNPRLRHPPGSRQPTLVRTIAPDELAKNAGYSRPHTLGCGPDGIFTSCLGGGNRADGPGGIALLDHDTFDVPRAWKTDRGPQWLATTPDGKRIYLTNSLYGSWDDQFYPDGVDSWLAKIDTDPHVGGGPRIDDRFFPHGADFRGLRVHQIRLQDGDLLRFLLLPVKRLAGLATARLACASPVPAPRRRASPDPGATAGAVAGFQRAGQLSPEAPRTCMPAGRSKNNDTLAVGR
jgi:hypothetical protein